MDHFKNVYDVKLKPRMLRGLIEEHFPEETQPTRIRYELSKIAFLIRTHKLLSESANDSMEKKLVDSWKSAVDEWVVRVSSLVSSNMVKIIVLFYYILKIFFCSLHHMFFRWKMRNSKATLIFTELVNCLQFLIIIFSKINSVQRDTPIIVILQFVVSIFSGILFYF